MAAAGSPPGGSPPRVDARSAVRVGVACAARCRASASARSSTASRTTSTSPASSRTTSKAASASRSRARRAAVDAFVARLRTDAPPARHRARDRDAPLAPTGAAGLRDPPERTRAGPPTATVLADGATVRRVPRRGPRPRRSTLPLPVHELHPLRAALHDRHRAALRPRPHDDGGVPAVRGLPRASTTTRATAASTRSRSRARPAAPRLALLRRRRARRCRPATPRCAPPPRRSRRARSSRRRASAASTCSWTPATTRPSRACARARRARRSPSRSWCATSTRRARSSTWTTHARAARLAEAPIVLRRPGAPRTPEVAGRRRAAATRASA